MRILRLKMKDKQNSGFSIVELVVAIGILAVIGTIVAFMMNSSSKSYRRLSLEAQLQSEAQLVANAISEYAIDSYDAKNICTVNPGSQFDNTENKILLLRSNENISGTWTIREYVIALDRSEDKLYLVDRTLTDPSDPSDPTKWTAYSASLLGTYIKDFTVDLSHLEADNIIDFKLDYTKNERSYKGNYQVLMRNRAYADKELTPSTPDVANRLLLTLNPKDVFIDIVNGRAGQKYYETNLNGAGFVLSNPDGSVNPIQLTASVSSVRGNVDDTVEWDAGSDFRSSFNFLPADGTLSKYGTIYVKGDAKYYDELPDDYVVSIARSITDENGNVISGAPKQTKIHLRRVKEINLTATSGSTNWKKSYEDLGGQPSDDADVRGYCYANEYGVYQTMNLNASVLQKWVPYGGGLRWTLEMKPIGDDSEWTTTVDPRYARLQSSETDTSTMNAVIFGKSVANGQLFKVTVTSIFDDSKTASYVFGVAPWRLVTGGGYNSRGFYTNLNNYFTNVEFSGLSGDNDIEGLKAAIANNKNLIIEASSSGATLENGAFKLTKNEYGEWFLYIDYAASKYQFSGDEMLAFYNGSGIDLELYIWEANADGSKGKGYFTAPPFYYWLQPVYVHPANQSGKVIVLPPGDTSGIISTAMDAYNIIGPEYLGFYVDNGDGKFSSNLNGSYNDANPNLTVNMTSSYGDVEHYVDIASVTLTAKAPSNIRNANIMTFRVAAEPYYRLVLGQNNGNEYANDLKPKSFNGPAGYRYNSSLSVSTAPVADYRVAIANVIGDNAFIATPHTKGYPLASVKSATKNSKVEIDGCYDSSGEPIPKANVQAYFENGYYKCLYKGVVYTYNPTYHYWSR